MTRRQLFGALLAAPIAGAAALAVKPQDDSDRLQSMIDRCEREGRPFILNGGKYHLRKTLVLRGQVNITGCHFTFDPDPGYVSALSAADVAEIRAKCPWMA